MVYRINIIVLSHTPSSTEYFTNIRKLEPNMPQSTMFIAVRQFLKDPAGTDKELLVLLAKNVISECDTFLESVEDMYWSETGAALVGYSDERRFYIDLATSNRGYQAVLYLEEGNRIIEWADGQDRIEALAKLGQAARSKADMFV
jgi:hypothetical protein